MSVLFINEMFLVYKLETFTNCKEVKRIMVMIIAIILIFLSYEIFDQQLKINFTKFSALSSKKITPPPFLFIPPLKIQKVKVPPLFANIENFSDPSCRKGWE